MNISFGNSSIVKEKTAAKTGSNLGAGAGIAYGVLHSIKNKEDIFTERAKQGAEVLGSYKKGMAVAIGTRAVVVAGIVAACSIVGSLIGKAIDNKKKKEVQQIFADVIQHRLQNQEIPSIPVKDLDDFLNSNA